MVLRGADQAWPRSQLSGSVSSASAAWNDAEPRPRARVESQREPSPISPAVSRAPLRHRSLPPMQRAELVSLVEAAPAPERARLMPPFPDAERRRALYSANGDAPPHGLGLKRRCPPDS